MKIKFEIKQYLNLEALEKGLKVTATRILAKVRLKTLNGWTEYQEAIIDTGSPLAVIPRDLWQISEVTKYYPTEIRGIVPKGSAFVKATMGKAKCVLIDEINVSPLFEIDALLAHSPDVPFILGFSNMLDQVRLLIDCRAGECWTEL